MAKSRAASQHEYKFTFGDRMGVTARFEASNHPM
jgi:hypothetical protein